jgi:tetratricopeptide (TPR) repeat protein
MRHIAILAVALATALALAPPVWAGIVEDCEQELDPELGVSGCTAVIRSGQWQGKDLAWAYSNRGFSYANLGEHAQAIEDYNEALRIAPDDANAHINRGIAYYNLGKYRRAIEDYDEALRLDPGDAIAYYNRGLAYENRGEHARAIMDFARALRLWLRPR